MRTVTRATFDSTDTYFRCNGYKKNRTRRAPPVLRRPSCYSFLFAPRGAPEPHLKWFALISARGLLILIERISPSPQKERKI